MNSLGSFSLVDAADQWVRCNIRWIASAADWKFAEQWEKGPVDASDRRIKDSIDYARTGSKRWQWLKNEGSCVVNAADAAKRLKRNRNDEFAFAFSLSVTTDPAEQVIGFCYARRLWLGAVCVEFLGTNNAQNYRGVGSLLLYAIAEAARGFRSTEMWGECTADSQGFYQKTKAKLLHGELAGVIKDAKSVPKYPRDWQLPGAIDDRFVFGRRELILMSELLRVTKSH